MMTWWEGWKTGQFPWCHNNSWCDRRGMVVGWRLRQWLSNELSQLPCCVTWCHNTRQQDHLRPQCSSRKECKHCKRRGEKTMSHTHLFFKVHYVVEYDLTFQIEIRVIDLSFSLKASVISGRSILCARFLCLPSKFLFCFFLLSVISFKQLKTTICWVITGYKDIHSSLLVVSHNRANILETRKRRSYFYLLLA